MKGLRLEGCGELEAWEGRNQVFLGVRETSSRALRVEATGAPGLCGGCGARRASLGGGWDEGALGLGMTRPPAVSPGLLAPEQGSGPWRGSGAVLLGRPPACQGTRAPRTGLPGGPQ